MVGFELDDYRTIIKWFELCFADKPEKINMQDKKTFWKLSFLCEDKIKEIGEEHEDRDV